MGQLLLRMPVHGAAALAMEREDISDRCCLIAGRGQIDLYSAPEFRFWLAEAIDGGAAELIVDMTAVDFIDSTALGVLVGVSKRLRALDGTLAIVLPDASMRQAFELAGLTDQFSIHATRASAVESLR